MDRFINIKNNEIANALRYGGNIAFFNGDYFDALVLYNHSISMSVPGSLSMSLAFGNRSAVYFRTTNYKNCLNNIKLARQNKFPKEKLQKLLERQYFCLELLAKKKTNAQDDPWTFFKLSYPSNPKIPFIVDRLELTSSEKDVYSIKTNKSLKYGDIVSIEIPFFSIVDHKSSYIKCAHCFSSNLLDLVPCKRCITSEYTCFNHILNIQIIYLPF